MTSLECAEGTVPGWLDESGLPTSCVGDLPLLEPMPERTVSPEVIEPMPPAPFDEGELIDPITVVPEVLANTGSLAHPLILAAVGLAILALGLALWAAWSFSRSSPKPRLRRSPQRYEGVESSPEVDSAPFPNLLRK